MSLFLFFGLGLDMGTKEVCKGASPLKTADFQAPRAQEQFITLKNVSGRRILDQETGDQRHSGGIVGKIPKTSLILTSEELE